MQYSDAILNNIATNLTRLQSPAPPSLTLDVGSVEEYLLNDALRPIQDHAWRIFGSYFIARGAAARAAYRAATTSLSVYMNALPADHHTNVFRDAIERFEQCVHHARVAMDLVQHMEAKAGGSKSPNGFVYAVNDGSPEDRLAKLDNRAKHFAEDILDGMVSHPTPIWIEDAGLVCSKAALSYVELAQLLEEIGENLTFIARGAFSIATP